MHRIGFSTGAVARGDYKYALKVLRSEQVRVVELSALRVAELGPLVGDLDNLDLSWFSSVSFHAPSRFDPVDECAIIEKLKVVTRKAIPIVVHPDTCYTDELWTALGGSMLIENMDKRKPIGRTAIELTSLFKRFPDAGFCFDIGHARQVDPTMTEAYRILDRHAGRLKQVLRRSASSGSPRACR